MGQRKCAGCPQGEEASQGAHADPEQVVRAEPGGRAGGRGSEGLLHLGDVPQVGSLSRHGVRPAGAPSSHAPNLPADSGPGKPRPAPTCLPKGPTPPKCPSCLSPPPARPLLHLQGGSRVGRDATVVLSGHDTTGQRGPGHGAHSWERKAGRGQTQGPEEGRGGARGKGRGRAGSRGGAGQGRGAGRGDLGWGWGRAGEEVERGRGWGGAGAGPGGQARGRGRAGEPTYLVEELGKLHFHLFALEHVVLGLLTDGRDQVELPGNGVGLLGEAKRGMEGP